MRCRMSLVSAKNWSNPQHFSWSASKMLARTGVSRLCRPLDQKKTNQKTSHLYLKNSNESNHRTFLSADVLLLGEAAGNRHLCAPLNLAILKLLLTWDGSWGLLCDNLVPETSQTWCKTHVSLHTSHNLFVIFSTTELLLMQYYLKVQWRITYHIILLHPRYLT